MNALYLQRRLTSKLVRISIIAICVILIGSYALWRSLNYARGPEIHISSPTDGSIVSATTTQIVGIIERAIRLYLNGNPINMDEQGNFKENIVVFKGANFITIVAEDQFDRSIKSTLRIFRP